jgi:hypothetical protein
MNKSLCLNGLSLVQVAPSREEELFSSATCSFEESIGHFNRCRYTKPKRINVLKYFGMTLFSVYFFKSHSPKLSPIPILRISSPKKIQDTSNDSVFSLGLFRDSLKPRNQHITAGLYHRFPYLFLIFKP